MVVDWMLVGCGKREGERVEERRERNNVSLKGEKKSYLSVI